MCVCLHGFILKTADGENRPLLVILLDFAGSLIMIYL